MNDFTQSTKSYKLSPSDFKFLWEDCKYCYFQKVANNITLPSSPFPSIFGKMNSLMQNLALGKNLKDLHPDLPSGDIIISEGFLKSTPIPPSNKCFISGRFDLLAKLDDGTYCVIDLKISNPREGDIYKYGKQLHAYKYALENPAEKDPIKISKMGLLVVDPESVEFINGKILMHNLPTWIEVEDNMDGFLDFIDEVSNVLSGECPVPSEKCGLCKYRTTFLALSNNTIVEEELF